MPIACKKIVLVLTIKRNDDNFVMNILLLSRFQFIPFSRPDLKKSTGKNLVFSSIKYWTIPKNGLRAVIRAL